MRRLAIILTACMMLAVGECAVVAGSSVRVKGLRCEYRVNPLGIDVVKPRLNWILQSSERGQKQTAYRVLAASSREKLTSDEGDLWDGDGKASAWSEPAMWSMGLLDPDDWKAQWIANAKDLPGSEAGPMPATMLRKSFAVDGPIKRATVHVTGLGLYELHLNGRRVGDHILAPEFSVYDKRIQYQTFDVTDLLVSGDNTVGAILGDGWHGEYFFGMPLTQAQRPFKGRRGFIMRLDIEQTDGTTQTIVTDKSWRSTREGPIRSGSLYDGEVYDARMEMPGWDRSRFDDSLWDQAVVADYLAGANLVWQHNEPIRVVKELEPVKMTEPKPGVYVFDLGQNMVGWCRLKVHGRAGTTVTLRHAEMLNDDGTIYTANLRGAKQTDIYTKRTGDEEIYEPHFTYHGFRYVELTGTYYQPAIYMPAYKPNLGDVLGGVFHSASPDAGHFQCSNALINNIMHMIVWVQRGNIVRAAEQQAITATGAGARVDWTQSYDAGYTDGNGAYAGGSEIMHLVPHKGKLYAANGYWEDALWEKPAYAEKQSAQVLRLDSADGRWEVDLDMGKSNCRGLRYMKGNILKSVTFTRDELSKLLPRPQNLLVMAAGAYVEKHGVVSAWVRDDAAGTWNHGIVKYGSRLGGIRWVPRDMEVYRDKVTGAERLFLLIGNPGIISGVYDNSHPAKIRWDEKVEFPASGTFSTRPLGIVEANGSLFFSVGGVIYQRTDGPSPTYTKVLNLGDGVNTDVGGIRGLTTIANPNGAGESILFLWAPSGKSIGQIKRLDPDGSGGYTAHDEANMCDLMSAELGVEVGYALGAHSNMYPVVHPVTGETVHIIGFQGKFQGSDHLKWEGKLYAGAMYAIRTADQTYTVHEVNGAYAPGKPVLVSPRTFAHSPFGDNLLFIGGHDASSNRSDDMAWIFKASLDVVLGLSGDR